MSPGADARALVCRFEGCRLRAYPDPASGGAPWTIGWGHTGPEVRRGLVWTQAQADAALAADLARVGAAVARLIGAAPTTQRQFDALVSFAYNLGAGALAGSTLLKKHRAGDHTAAHAEFAKWNKASGKPMPGLTKRRAAEAAVYAGADAAHAIQSIEGGR